MYINSFVAQVSPPLDRSLAAALLTEFVDLERRFVLGDWEPATLNGGQFAEVSSRIIYHLDSKNLNCRKDLNSCLAYVEDDKNSNRHSFPNRRASLHLCKVLRVIYKFRSQRGAIHIDPDYTANELDSTLILSLSRWVMSEVLRTFWSGNPSEVAKNDSRNRQIPRSVPSLRVMVVRSSCGPTVRSKKRFCCCSIMLGRLV